jgi:hypothetical protein
MLRYVRLFHSELAYQLPGGEFSVRQQFYDGDPSRMRERLEDVGFKTS